MESPRPLRAVGERTGIPPPPPPPHRQPTTPHPARRRRQQPRCLVTQPLRTSAHGGRPAPASRHALGRVRRLRRDGGEREVVLLVHLPDGRGVRAPRGEHAAHLVVAHHLAHPGLGGLDAAGLLHAHHLVAHDLAPVGAVLVGLHHGHVVVVVVDDERLLPGGLVDTLCAVLEDIALLRLEAGVDDGHLAAKQLVAGHHHAERREGRGVVLDDHAVVHAEHGSVGHVPPAHGLLVPVLILVEHAARVLNVAAVLLLRRVRAEARLGPGRLELELDLGDGGVAGIRALGVDAHLAALGMVDRADLEAVLVAAQHA
mmetsp:Transcript_34124/g.81165  ORF Transcript_34124/g.81165 Transcript_34124/m.81165 type:complete len:314 (-) Transcript_34124:1176-2117(-)